VIAPEARRIDLQHDKGRDEERTSAVVRALAASVSGEHVTFETILHALRDRGFGTLIILFALPNAIIPGMSIILGAPVVLFSLQLAFGRDEVWLPAFIHKRTIRLSLFQKTAARVEQFLLWIEKRSKLRWTWFVTGVAERFLGLYIAIIAAFLMTPVPLGNALPAIGISLMAIGLIEKDGKAAAAGAVIGFLGTLYIGTVIVIGIEALKALIGVW
jgi:hypothetical protein